MKFKITREELRFIYECLENNRVTEENISFAAYEVVEDYVQRLPFIRESTDPTVINRLRKMFINWLKHTLPILKKINNTYIHHIKKTATESFIYENNKDIQVLLAKQKKLKMLEMRINNKLKELGGVPSDKVLGIFKTTLGFVSMYIQISVLPKEMKAMYRIASIFISTILSSGLTKLFIYLYPIFKRFTDRAKQFLGIEVRGLDKESMNKFHNELKLDIQKLNNIKQRNIR